MTPEVLGLGLGAVRVLSYVGVVLLVGPMLFRTLVRPVGRLTRRVLRLTAVGLIATSAATVCEPLLRVLAPTGELAPLTPLAGAALLIRAAALVTWGAFLPDLVRGDLRGLRRLMVWLVSVIVAASLALQTNPPSAVTSVSALAGTAVTTLHIVAMAAWLGGLVTMVTMMVHHPGEDLDAEVDDLHRILPRYTALSRWSLVILAGTGVAHLVVEPGETEWGISRYGLTLLLKLTLLAIMVVLGSQGRRFAVRTLLRRQHRLGPRMISALRALRLVLALELLVGVLVLAATAGLVALGSH